MFDLSSKFNAFYKSYVVLPQEELSGLYQKKDLNVRRLKDGLEKYNEDNGTAYSIVDTCVQGSVATHTIIQNEKNDYDIDVAIVFDKDNHDGKGAQAARNMVANALRYETKQFNAEPEVKTSCVRIKYADGYHIDFAVYRRCHEDSEEKWIYEHAGANWEERDLTGLTDWFNEQNDSTDKKLRKVVRLSKMFCKSRDSWKNMPSGLNQMVLCAEKLQTRHDRIDELFYYTMDEIVKRLENDISVSAPVDNGRDLTPRKIDKQKMTNWKNRLKSKLEDLDVLFDPNCTREDAIQAWYGFFNHEFWNETTTDIAETAALVVKSNIKTFSETEEFIEDFYPVDIRYCCCVSCSVSGNGWHHRPIASFLKIMRVFLPNNFEIKCQFDGTNCPKPYEIFWKVKNAGPEAERRNMIRGQIEKRGNSIVEHTNFFGNHYIECYIVKNSVCVAKTRINVPIGRRAYEKNS